MKFLLMRLLDAWRGKPRDRRPGARYLVPVPVQARRKPRTVIRSAPAFSYEAMRAAFEESANFDPPPRGGRTAR